MKPQTFSPAWYDIFLARISAEQTAAEVAFIARQLPRATHSFMLDVCCGPGRHANLLAERGYRIVGIDRNSEAIERARLRAPAGASYRTIDMRDLDTLSERFDGVLNLWASFGYFDDATNESVVRQIAARLRDGGRAVIDLYNRDHMETLPAAESAVRGSVAVATTREWSGSRLKVRLEYDARFGDEFEWRLYTPHEFSALCAAAGLQTLLSCAWFTESTPPSGEHARMQFVLERRDSS